MSTIPTTLPKFLWYFAKRYPLNLLALISVAFCWGMYNSLTPYAMKLIIDKVTETSSHPDSLFSEIYFPVFFYVFLGFAIGLVFRFYDWVMLKTFPNMKNEIIKEMFEYVEEHSYRYFQNNFAGSLSNKINDMAKGAATIITTVIDYFLARFFVLVVATTTMFFVHPFFAILLFSWGLIFITAAIFFSKKSQKYSEIFSHSRSLIIGKIVDSISNILNVKLFSAQRFESDYLNKYLEDTAEKDRELQWYLLKVKSFYMVSVTLLTVAMTALLVYARSKEMVTVGDFALILTLTMWQIEAFFSLANQLVTFSETVGTCQQALSIISPKQELIDHPHAQPLRVTKGQIIFDRVHFRYKKGQNIFTNKSITIHSGEKVGLVGFSGSGKSTFVNLILRFFDLDSGAILIDDQDIKKTTQESLRRQIALIPQDPFLFHRSLLENIRYGRLDASDEEVIASAKKAHCHEFIEKLKEGYHSLAGERGVMLSGGQKQRIAIARVILKNAPILILDEATSSLDSVTENYIQESLAYLMKERTTLVIAHRLSTLLHMDRILVFHNGKIIEEGSHKELLALNGHYAKLWNMQAGGFLSD